MVRCGIALYGCSPFGGDPADDDLRPAMSLVSYLASVKTLRSRESVGYGRLWRAARGTRVGLVPVGYADGYARALSGRARGARGRPARAGGGHDLDGPADGGSRPGGPPRASGEEVVLLGAQGGERISAEERRGLARDDQLRGHLRRRARASRGSTRGEPPDLEGPRRTAAPRSAATAWAVGGGVRDALTGRPVADLDVAVAGDAAVAAATLCARPRRTRFRLSRAFGAWRVQGGDLAAQVDITPLQGGTIEEDLARRDLTVNAMAVPVARRRAVIDPPRRPRTTSRPAACGWSARPPSPTTPCACCGWRASAEQIGFSVDAGDRARGRAATPRLIWDTPGERLADELGRIASPRPARPGVRADRRDRRARGARAGARGVAGPRPERLPPQGRPRAHARGRRARGGARRRPRAGLPRTRRRGCARSWPRRSPTS